MFRFSAIYGSFKPNQSSVAMRPIEFSIARVVQVALMTIAAGVSCKETTGPETIDPPTGVSAVMISPSSARITWTAGARSRSVTSYSVFRNGTKVAEVQAASHVDEGLAELTSYQYSVSANGRDGIVSALSAESPSAAVTPPDVTAPRVTSTTPAAAATAVPRAALIRVTFSEAMTPATINASTFLVRTSTGSVIEGTVTYLPATFTAEFVPALSLPNATSIALTITTGVRDQSGNAMTAPFGFAFTVRDEVVPSVLSVIPADLATGVSTGTSALIVFSKTMDAATINPSSVTLRLTATGTFVSGGVSYDAASRAVTFIPTAPLDPGSSYTVQVSTAVKDSASNALAQAFASSFVTAPVVAPPPPPLPPPPPPPPDDVPPTVTASAPANGSVNVPVTLPVAVRFSEAMNPSTITVTTFHLSSGGSFVAGSVTYDAGTRVATLTPNSSLAPNQTYTATVTTGVKDAAGNALGADESFSFTTASSLTAPATTFLWVMVVDASGVCIPGATVRVVLGQRAGEIVTQRTPCDVWGYDGGVTFYNLIVGAEMTLQATAPGYSVQEKRIIPTSGPQTVVTFEPPKA